MPTYVALQKLTDKGRAEMKDFASRLQAAGALAEKYGVRMTAYYRTMGEYDYIAIAEAPNDEAIMAFTMAIDSRGYLITTGVPAISMETLGKIVSQMP